MPDALGYMNPRFRSNVLLAVVQKANDIFQKLTLAQPRFKGKCSLICHSLGSVISYDILRRQDYRNFEKSKWIGAANDVCKKIRRGEDFKPIGAKESQFLKKSRSSSPI